VVRPFESALGLATFACGALWYRWKVRRELRSAKPE